MSVFSQTSLQPGPPHQLAHALEMARNSGTPLIDLSLSNPTHCGLTVDAEAILHALHQTASLVYEPEPLGIESARLAVAATFARDIRPEPNRVLLTASTSEAYGYLLKLLCDPGDCVLVPEPGYPLLQFLARLERVTLKPYRIAYDGRWHFDLGSIREACNHKPKAIVVVSPNNPTGNVMSDDELEYLSKLGLPIIADEVFGSYALAGSSGLCQSALRNTQSLTFSLGGLSKYCGLPQLKLAWLAASGPSSVVAEAMQRLELIADTYLSVASPVQHALPTLLELGTRTQRAIRDRIRRNLAALRRELHGSANTVLHVEAGWYAAVLLPDLRTEDDWILDILAHDHVVLQPGWFYDFERSPTVVISLLPMPKDFDEGIRRIARRVSALCR